MADKYLLETGVDDLLKENGDFLLKEAIVGAASGAVSAGTTTPRLTMPPGIEAGDIAYMWVNGNSGAINFSAGTGNWTGWTQVGATTYNSTTLFTALFTKTLAGTESGQSTGPDVDVSLRASSFVVVLRGYELDGAVGIAQKANITQVRTMVDWAATPTLAADGEILISYAAARGSVAGEIPRFAGQGTFWRELTQATTGNGTTANNGAIVRARTMDDNAGNGLSFTPADVDTTLDVDRQNTFTLAFKPAVAVVSPPAGTASEVDTAPTPSTIIAPSADLVTSTDSSPQASATVSVNAGVAVSASSSPSATANVRPNAGLVTTVSSAQQASGNVSLATTIALTGSTSPASASKIQPNAPPAASAGTSPNATVSTTSAAVTVNAGVAASAGSAPTPSVTVLLNAGVATSVSSAPQPAATIKPNTGLASSSGSSPNATASVVNLAPAGVAASVGSSPSATPVVKPNAGLVTTVGSAQTPSARVFVNAGVATSAGSAQQPTVSTAVITNVNAGVASSVGSAPDPKVSLSLNAQIANSWAMGKGFTSAADVAASTTIYQVADTGSNGVVTKTDDNAHFITGTSSIKVVGDGAADYQGVQTFSNQFVAASPGERWTARVWVWADASVVGKQLHITIHEFNSSNVYQGESVGALTPGGVGWYAMAISRTLGPSAASVGTAIKVYSTARTQSIIWVEDFRIDRLDTSVAVSPPAAGVASSGGTSPSASIKVSPTPQSQLVRNGAGELGSNANWAGSGAGTTYDAGTVYNGHGTLKLPAGATAVFSDDFIRIDPDLLYAFFAALKTDVVAGQYYAGFAAYDRDGFLISPYMTWWQANTLTTLAADLNPGDTTITLTSAANWHNGANAAQRLIGFWDYVDGTGYAWPSQTYTRDINTANTWAAAGITGNVITLSAPFVGTAKPAGTPVSNMQSGGTFLYQGTSGQNWPNTSFLTVTGALGGGYETAGTWQSGKFPQGTRYVKPIVLNLSNPTGQAWIGEISITAKQPAISWGDSLRPTVNVRPNAGINYEQVFPFDSTVEGWGGYTGGDTVSWDGTEGHNTLGALKVVSVSGYGAWPPPRGAVEGATFTSSVWLKGTNGVTYQLYNQFWDARGNALAGSGATNIVANGSWQFVTLTTTAPANSVQHFAIVRRLTAPSSDTFWLDDASVIGPSGISTAFQPRVIIKVNAGVAASAGTAPQPSVSTAVLTNVNAGVASSAGSAQDPKPSIFVNAGVATSPDTAPQGPPKTSVNAGVATSVGSSPPGWNNVSVNAGTATSAGSAQGATIAPVAGAATAVGSAPTPRVTVAVNAGVAASSGSSPSGTANVKPNAELAASAGSALPATVNTSSATNIPAQVASSAGSAPTPSVTVLVNAGVAASASSSPAASANVKPNAVTAQSAGSAQDAKSNVQPNASTATSVGSAQTPTTKVFVNAGVAASTGTSPNAVVSTSSAANVTPNAAASVGSALDAQIRLSVNASTATSPSSSPSGSANVRVNTGVATSAGSSPAATANTSSATLVNSGVSTSLGSAPTPSVTVKVNAGVATSAGASSASVAISVNAGVAGAGGTAPPEANVTLVRPTTAISAGTAPQPSPSIKVNAGVAGAGGTAPPETGVTLVRAGVATSVGTAPSPTPKISVKAGLAASGGIAHTANASSIYFESIGPLAFF